MAKRQIAYKATRGASVRFPGKPIKISETAWFYTQPKGMLVVTELFDTIGSFRGTAQCTIPWRKVEAALGVYRRVKRSRQP